MYKRLLVALDGSTTAEQVLPFVRTLARGLNLPVELFAVIDARALLTSVAKARVLDGLLREGKHKAENYLFRISRELAKHLPGKSIRYFVEEGEAAQAIVDKAAQKESTLIAMTTHGRSGLQRWLMGSVAEKVLRTSKNALLLIRAAEGAPTEGEAKLSSLIIPLDGSPLAEQVLPVATKTANKLGAEMFLLRAYRNPFSPFISGGGLYAANVAEVMEDIRNEARSYLEAQMTLLQKQGIEQVSYLLQEGDAADEIVATAQSNPEYLIAMTSHGRAGMERWALGSVAETVVRHSSNPVLMLRGGAQL